MNKIYQVSNPILPRPIKYRALTLKDVTMINNITNEYLNDDIYNDIYSVITDFDIHINKIFTNITDIDVSSLNYVQKAIVIISIIANAKDDVLSIKEHIKNENNDIKEISFSFKISEGLQKYIKDITSKDILTQHYLDYEVKLKIPHNTENLLQVEDWVDECYCDSKIIDYQDIPVKMFDMISKDITSFIKIPLIDIKSKAKNPFTGEAIEKNIQIPNLYFFFMIFIGEYLQ